MPKDVPPRALVPARRVNAAVPDIVPAYDRAADLGRCGAPRFCFWVGSGECRFAVPQKNGFASPLPGYGSLAVVVQCCDYRMEKDFDSWNQIKKKTEAQEPRRYTAREIWWCRFGVNVGTEDSYLR